MIDEIFSPLYAVYVKAGVIGVLIILLMLLVRIMYNNMRDRENKLQLELAKEQRRRDEDDARRAKENEALVRRIRELEARALDQARADVAMISAAMGEMAKSGQANERSRRRLDTTLRALYTLIYAIQPGQKLSPPSNSQSAWITPIPAAIPDDTPPSGLEVHTNENRH